MTAAQPSRDETAPKGVDEARISPRHPTRVSVRIAIETAEFSGQSENISSGGVFLFTSDKIRVRVLLDEGGEVRSFPGRIARVQQMNAEQSGFAIEFDRE